MSKKLKENKQCQECVFAYYEIRDKEKNMRCMRNGLGYGDFELIKKCAYFLSEEEDEEQRENNRTIRLHNKQGLINQSNF